MENSEINAKPESQNNLKAELGFLKSQVTPHVLFNTLSYIKFAVTNDALKAEEAVDCLSDLLSYAINQSAGDAVLLREEVEQMENMIKLQEMRFDGRQNLNFSVFFEMGEIRIIPLVFITLLENIFRHGNTLRKDAAIAVELRLSGGYLTFSSSNSVSAMHSKEKSGNGLQLCKQRLNDFYAEDYSFEYGLSGEYFTMILKIPVRK